MQNLTYSLKLVVQLIKIIIALPIWYTLRQKPDLAQKTPYLLILLFYASCIEVSLVIWRVHPEFDPSVYKTYLLALLLLYFGCNFIETKILAIFVMPAYLMVGIMQVFAEKASCDDSVLYCNLNVWPGILGLMLQIMVVMYLNYV
jgi:hypothetical protein